MSTGSENWDPFLIGSWFFKWESAYWIWSMCNLLLLLGRILASVWGGLTSKFRWLSSTDSALIACWSVRTLAWVTFSFPINTTKLKGIKNERLTSKTTTESFKYRKQRIGFRHVFQKLHTDYGTLKNDLQNILPSMVVESGGRIWRHVSKVSWKLATSLIYRTSIIFSQI